MALSNSQYDELMRTYEQRQSDNEYNLRMRYREVYDAVPAIKEIDDSISSLSIEKAKSLIDGDDSALSSFRADMAELTARKQALLKKNHFPGDYLLREFWSRKIFPPARFPIILKIILIL